jgi:hypothetical protein
MSAAAGIEHGADWGDYVWLPQRERSRIYPVAREFFRAIHAATSAAAGHPRAAFIRGRKRDLLMWRLKYGFYALLGRSRKKEEYGRRIAHELRILGEAQVFFGVSRLKPGQLVEIMNRYGSDKGSGRHNYALFYEMLFERDRERYARVFELGIGSNNVDVPSNMGADGIPGASLRGWREYFIKADIFGADIDSRILFEEDRIKTAFVDQTRPDSVERLFGSFGGEFDLIVDDGLHQSQANRTFFECAFKQLKIGGLYIIEDLARAQKDSYKAFLTGYDAAILDIPHQRNYEDNCLAVVAKS